MRWSVVFAVGALALVAGGALAWTAISQDREFQRLIATGDRALADGQPSLAIEAFSGAAALEPDAMVSYLKRGDTYRRRGDYVAALRDLERAIALEPTATRPIELLGDVHLAMGRFGPAAAQYRRFLTIDDRSARVSYKLALCQFREGRAAEAIEVLDETLTLDPRLPEAHYLLGLALRAQGRDEEAAASLSRAVAFSPAFSAAREELAGLYRARGLTREAVEQLEALAALDPEAADRLVRVSLAYHAVGRMDMALATITRALERHPDEPRAYTALGRIWLDETEVGGDPTALERAARALETAIAKGADDPATLGMYGRVLLRAGDLSRAEGVLQQATARRPTSAGAFRDLAEVAGRLGHTALAEESARRLAALESASP